MGPVRASPRFNKCSVVERCKTVIDEPAEKEDNLQDLIDEIYVQLEEE